MFHASLTQFTKSGIVELFQSCTSPLRILVATVAFGMVRELVVSERLRIDLSQITGNGYS